MHTSLKATKIVHKAVLNKSCFQQVISKLVNILQYITARPGHTP